MTLDKDGIDWTHSLQFNDTVSGVIEVGTDRAGIIHVSFSGETSPVQIESFIERVEVLFIQCKNTLRHEMKSKEKPVV